MPGGLTKSITGGIHLNPVRASLVKQPGKWQWTGHSEYLGKEKRGLIDSGPVMGQLRTAASYEAFIREGAKLNYRAEWHPGDGAPFLGPGRFVKKIAQESVPPSSSRRITLKDLLKSAGTKFGLSAEVLFRKGRLGSVVNARDRFVRDAVLQHGYLACQVASFIKYQPHPERCRLGKSFFLQIVCSDLELHEWWLLGHPRWH